MQYWRRTLASLLQSRNKTPVVVSMYCEYEGSELTTVLEDAGQALSTAAIDTCDAYIRKRYRGANVNRY